jgi:DNA-binding MarR family transcriptional regulator
MGMDRSTLGRNILPLERDGLITIGQAEADQRSKEVKLTAAGAEKQRSGLKHWQAAQAGFEKSFGPKRAAELRALLGAVVASEFAQVPG